MSSFLVYNHNILYKKCLGLWFSEYISSGWNHLFRLKKKKLEEERESQERGREKAIMVVEEAGSWEGTTWTTGKAPDEITCPLCFSTCLSLPTHWHGGRQGKTISESEAVYEFGIVWTSFASPTLPIP